MSKKYEPQAGRDMAYGLASKLTGDAQRLRRLGLSPRQQELNWLWSHYMCSQYEGRKIDWDGSEHMTHTEKVAVASGRQLPSGFTDTGGQTAPIKFRRPSAPYHLCKVIVERFTSLIFSQRRAPAVSVLGDSASEDFASAIIKTGGLWATMVMARTFGGATGSACVGFQFRNGKPMFECHDPRWVFPKFIDKTTLELASIEKRYIFYVEEYDQENEVWVDVPYWYRRVIDEDSDIVFKPAPVGRGEEPRWEEAKVVKHNFGFCPAVWIQNIPVVGDIDGLPDCHGTYDMMERMDMLNAQAEKGAIANCDPTLVVSSEGEMDEIGTGSDNAIKVPGGTVSYLELTGGGIKTALEMAQNYRGMILEVAQCFLEGDKQGGAMTATEVERMYSSMLSKADTMRTQYGDKGVKPLMEKVLRAAEILMEPVTEEGRVVRRTVALPPKIDPETSERTPHVLNPGPHVLEMKWPPYFAPSSTDTTAAVGAAAGAKAAKLVDKENAARMVASHFQVEDVPAMLKKIEAEEKEEMANAMGGGGFGY